MKKETVKTILTIVKYAVTLLLGYLGGSTDVVTTTANLMGL